ncbi:hypothetical protein ACLB2K_071418 [Fragaria x ananassa]
MANNDLFSSLISDIKSYSGKDPLLPWLRGIRKLQASLPQKVLEQKLPRFLQKCAQTFQSDERYRNEARYLRVWLKLMDFVEDPKELLRTMEANRIGTKHPMFYQAYALYYEKNKRFEEAEKMYHLGVQNHADPIEELEKAYEQFLQRMERHRKRKHQVKRTTKKVSDRSRVSRISGERNIEKECRMGDRPRETRHDGTTSKHQVTAGGVLDERSICSDDTVVGKFVGTAIVGKSEAEDACHHGLVDPTINMKEAMSAINSMFREPLEMAPVRRGSRQSQQKENNTNNGFQVFVDENLEKGGKSKDKGVVQQSREPLNIFIDDDEDCLEQSEVQNKTEDSSPSASHENAFVFLNPKDVPSESPNGEGSSRPRFREDTMMVRRIVGTTISEDPQVENACHHGLVEPTINLKEAMDDINNMFGKPIDFVRSRRVRRQDKVPEKKQDLGGFCILPDDEDDSGDDNLEQQEVQKMKDLPAKSKDSDLFETTVFTKQAMDDINKMFGMPLDF